MLILSAVLAACCLAMSGCKAIESLDAAVDPDRAADEKDSTLSPKQEGWNPPDSMNTGEDSSF